MRIPFLSALLQCLICGVGCAQLVQAQEASSGFDLRTTLTAQAVASNELTEAPRSGSPMILGSRSAIYPTYKISDNWLVTSAIQLSTRPYYFNELSTAGYGAKGAVLQGTLNYARFSRKGSVLVRVGVMPTAFGSFLLRYDDADNILVDLPLEYGYYYSPVSMLGVAGARSTRRRASGMPGCNSLTPPRPIHEAFSLATNTATGQVAPVTRFARASAWMYPHIAGRISIASINTISQARSIQTNCRPPPLALMEIGRMATQLCRESCKSSLCLTR